MIAALAAAAFACTIDSSMNLGEWASPARKTPSVAKSTGLNFMCASKKKPSSLRGTLNILERTSLSFRGTMPFESTR